MEKQPEWVKALVESDFYTAKGQGTNANNLNCLCIDCATNSMTEHDMLTNHNGHSILRAYKCSEYYGYRKENTKKVRGLDVSSVAVFQINGHDIVFPRSRKALQDYTNKNVNAVPNCCFTCGWSLKNNPGFFCSIKCKLVCPQPEDQVKGLSIMGQNQVSDFEGTSVSGYEKAKSNNKNNGKMKINKAEIKLGVNGGRIDKDIGGSGSGIGNEEKFKNLISVVGDIKSCLTGKKRSRKGIPCRSPLL